VAPGTYSGSQQIGPDNSAATGEADRMYILGDPDAAQFSDVSAGDVHLASSGYQMWVSNTANYVTISNFYCTGSTYQGTLLGGTGLHFTHNVMDGMGGSGHPMVTTHYAGWTDAVFSHNTFINGGATGIDLQNKAMNNVTITNNLFNVAGTAINYTATTLNGVHIYSNTVSGSATAVNFSGVTTGSVDLYNNILDGDVNFGSPTNLLEDYNNITGDLNGHTIGPNSTFVEPNLDEDYYPTAAELINAGDNAYISWSEDLYGDTRIQDGLVDLGALEGGLVIIPLYGDCDRDDDVDDTDLNLFLVNYGTTSGATWETGDFDYDDDVDQDDLDLLLGNYGTQPGSEPLPEPAGLSLLAIGGLALLKRKRVS
jgi:hypothetical protein